MIIDKIGNALHYLGIDPYLDLALRDIVSKEHASVLADGKVKRSESEYRTVRENDFEMHLIKADIHIVTAGEEKILFSDPESLTVLSRDEEHDCIMSRGEAKGSCVLRPGLFVLLLPGEPHAVHLAAGEETTVHKIVYKIDTEK